MIERFETQRQLAIFLSVALVFLLSVAVALASAASRVGLQSPGFAVWSNLVVPALSVQSRAATSTVPFRSVLTHVDGEPVRSAADLRRGLEAAPLGSMHEYRFLRDGRELQALLPSVSLHWRDVLPVLAPYLLVGSAFFAMVLIVFFFRPAHPAARAVLAAGGTLGAVLILAIDTVSAGWLERVYFLVEAIVPGAFLHFSLCFPEKKEILRRQPALEWIVYLPFLAFGVLENVVLRHSPQWHLRLNDAVYTAIAITGLVMVGSLLHTYATSRNPLARQRAKVVTAGLGLAALVPSLGLFSVILFGAPLPINVLTPVFVFFPLSVAYAIARHDLFEVDRYVRTGVVYAALSLLVFLGYAGVVLAAERVIGAEQRLPAGMVPLYLVVVLLAFQPLRTRIQNLVDRLFYRQTYSYRGTVEQTSRLLASMLETERIAATLLSTVTEVMAIEWGALVLPEASSDVKQVLARPRQIAARIEAAADRDTDLIARMTEEIRPLTLYDHGGDGGPPARDATGLLALRALGAALLLPLRFEEKPIGVLLLGEKRSGAFYSEDDVALLETLAHQSALALENARAYELLRQTRDELVKAERLAAVGQLSAAVAHGIRNPLAGIRAAAQVAREDLPDGDAPLAETLDDILAETDRLEARVRSVLDLARPFEPRLTENDLNDFVRRFASGLRLRVPDSVELALELDAHVPAVCFDAAHLTEALDVLTTNALQAMRGDGRLLLTTRLLGNGAERSAVIEVSDSGPGMTTAQIERAFELFYTTKSGGTGIGLPMARRFIEAQGGTLEVASEAGAGATFRVRLPVRDGVTAGRSA